MTRRTLGIASLLALAAAACSQQPVDDSNITIDETINAAEAANADVETLPPSDSPSGDGNGSADAVGNSTDEPPATASIPAQYRGRWGMVPNDCTPGRSDAKGLVDIGSDRMKFYESVAVLKEQRPAIATSFSGRFTYSGEGETWERVVTLTRTGDSLKFAQEDRSSTYKLCK